MKRALSKKQKHRLAEELIVACAEMFTMIEYGSSVEDHNAKLEQVNALTDKLGLSRIPVEFRSADDPDEFPPLTFVTENGERYAEIAGERYKLEKINGQPMLSETQLYQIIERHAPNEQAKAEALEAFRGMVAAATGSARSLQ